MDVLFTKFKVPGQHHLTYEGFLTAVSRIAAKKRLPLPALLEHLANALPEAAHRVTPVASGATVPRPNRFHDDVSTYTGVHKVGGPTTIDRSNSTLEKMVDRSVKNITAPDGADWFGGHAVEHVHNKKLQQQQQPQQQQHQQGGTSMQHSSKHGNPLIRSPEPVEAPPQPVDPHSLVDPSIAEALKPIQEMVRNGDVRPIFNTYIHGGPGVDSFKFLKFCKDFNVFDAKFRQFDMDVIYAKTKGKGINYISVKGFIECLQHISAKKCVTYKYFLDYLAYNLPVASMKATPTANATVPKPNRFHDDVNTYTGVHKAGGPTTIDRNHQNLQKMVDRSVANIAKAGQPHATGGHCIEHVHRKNLQPY
jgi:hypothetical protein